MTEKHEFIYLSLLIPNPLLQDVWTASYKRVSTQLGDRAVLPAHPIELKSEKCGKPGARKLRTAMTPPNPSPTHLKMRIPDLTATWSTKYSACAVPERGHHLQEGLLETKRPLIGNLTIPS